MSTVNDAKAETDCESVRNHASLIVDGHKTTVSADYSLLFVNHPDGPATPVLYFKGRRVIKAWSLELSHDEPADPWGCSG